jgi:predicted secreted protein
MRIKQDLFRAVALAILVCFVQTIFPPAAVLAQEASCPYDRAHPTLSNARISFKSLNYRCAEQEIQDYLKLSAVSLENRADAHMLLAAVYYAQQKNDKEKRARVIEQFMAAFKAYRDWRGDLDISSTEFIDMMKEAQVQVDKEAQKTPVTAEPARDTSKVQQTPPPQPPPARAEAASVKKPWYKKWWVIALGVGVVAGVVVAVAGGGGSDTGSGGDGQATSLPNFPPPPPHGKR